MCVTARGMCGIVVAVVWGNLAEKVFCFSVFLCSLCVEVPDRQWAGFVRGFCAWECSKI